MKVEIKSVESLGQCFKEHPDKIVVIKFGASWCGPCKKLAPLLEKIAESQDDIIIAEVSVNDNDELCKLHQVKSIPHCVIKSKNYTSESIIGLKPEKIIEELKIHREKRQN